MQFTTKVPVPKTATPIDYNSYIVSIGSCFAVNISEKLTHYKFKNTVNPFGILFHPLAIAKLVDYAINDKRYTPEDVFYTDGAWHCYDAHSELNTLSSDELVANLNTQLVLLSTELTKTTHVLITLGTAWVYQNVESQHIVANCHKVPQKQFKKQLLAIEEIKGALQKMIAQIKQLNPDCEIIITVSPVRHIKDGYVENQVSKAHLIAAVYDLVQNKWASYFPSYEIMMDELRDYRFYTQDMLHPTQTAIDYIWEKFAEATIDEAAIPTMELTDSIQKGLMHRPFNPNSEQHQKFVSRINEKIVLVQQQYPHIQF